MRPARYVPALVAAVLLAFLALGSAPVPAAEPRALLEAGSAAFRRGDLEAAIRLWAQADRAAAAREDGRSRIEALLRRAEALQTLGLAQEALGDLQTCRRLVLPDEGGAAAGRADLCQPLAGAAAPSPVLALLAGNLGRACASLGYHARARRLFEQSLTLDEDGGRAAAASLIHLGRLELAAGAPQAAAARFADALERARRDGAPDLAASAAIEAAQAALRPLLQAEDDPDPDHPARALGAAEAWLAQAERHLGAVRPTASRLRLLIAFGRAHLDALALGGQRDPGRIFRIWSRLREAVELAAPNAAPDRPGAGTSADWVSLSAATGELARLYEADARFQEVAGALGQAERLRDDALALTRQALQAAQRRNDPALLYRWYWQTARLLRAQAQPDAAIAAYARAIEHLERVRPVLLRAYGGFGASFRSTIAPVYLGYVDLLLRRAEAKRKLGQAASDPAARAAAETARADDLRAARAAVERLKSAELEDYFRDDCVAALEAKLTGVESLAADTAVLYPILLPDRIELILSRGDRLYHATRAVDRATLGREVARLRGYLVDAFEREVTGPAQQLYAWLIEPFAAELGLGAGRDPAVSTLVFVPDGPLRTIPLAALYDGAHYLIERTAVVVTPGLELVDPKRLPGGADLLLGALSVQRPGFSPLSEVPREIEAISGAFATRVLRDEGFVEAAFASDLRRRPYGIVHMATHAVFAPEADQSFLLTYDGKMTMNELEAFVKRSEFRENAVELLGLSACETAAGDERAALGLAGVGIKAGARSVFASLWKVSDAAAAELVSRFYGYLGAGTVSKAQALRQAQIDLLRQRKFEHPGLWAPFLLIGSWL